MCKKDYILNPATSSSKNGRYLASIINNSVIMFDDVIDGVAKSFDEEKKLFQQFLMKENIICEIKSFHILLVFLLISIVLLIAASSYLIKYE